MIQSNTTAKALAVEFREALAKRLGKMLGPLAEMNARAHLLSEMGVSATQISTADASAQILTSFLKDLERHLTQKYCGGTEAKVSFSGQRHDVPRHAGSGPSFYRIGHEIHRYLSKSEDIQLGLVAFLDEYPFIELAEEAAKQCAGLEEAGKQAAADSLARALHLVEYGHMRSSIKTLRQRVVSHMGIGDSWGHGYSYQVHDDLGRLATNFRIVQDEMGDLGAADAFEECAKIFRETKSVFPSRTPLLKGRPVEFLVFNNHMDIRFSHDVMDTLMAFLALHSTQKIQNLSELAA